MHRAASFSFQKLFLLFWGIVLILYGVAWRSGFERDFHGWFELYYYNDSFWDILNRKGAGIKSLYQLTQFQLWVWTTLFGTRLLPWFLLQTGLFAAAGACATQFLGRLYADFGWRHAKPTAFWGGILALVAPQGAEIAVWKASYHYPVAVLFTFGILGLFRKYLFTGRSRPLLWAVILYLLSTFTLELFYATLPLAALLLLIYRSHPAVVSGTLPKAWLYGIAPLLFLFIFHFGLYRVVHRGLIPHVEGPVLLALEEPWKALGRFFQIENHLLFQARYWPTETHVRVHEWANQPLAGKASLAVLLTLAAGFVYAGIRKRRHAPVLLLAAGAALGLLLILPSEVMRDGIYYNDRLFYFTGIFQWHLVAVGLYALLGRRAWLPAVLIALVLGALSFYTALQCRRASTVFWRALEDFRWSRSPETFLLLNVPGNYKWVVMFQEGPDNNEFASHLKIFRKDPVAGKLHAVAGYNMNHPDEGVRVQVEDRTHLIVTLTGEGILWNGNFGAADHGNAYYDLKLDEWMHQYRLTLKDTATRLLYFNQRQWKEVDFRRTSVEQQ